MKTICLHVVAATLSVVVLCQCQSGEFAGSSRKDYPVIERKTVHSGDKTFVQKRRLVREHPPESILEMVEVR